MLRFIYWFVRPFLLLGYLFFIILGVLGIIALIYATTG